MEKKTQWYADGARLGVGAALAILAIGGAVWGILEIGAARERARIRAELEKGFREASKDVKRLLEDLPKLPPSGQPPKMEKPSKLSVSPDQEHQPAAEKLAAKIVRQPEVHRAAHAAELSRQGPAVIVEMTVPPSRQRPSSQDDAAKIVDLWPTFQDTPPKPKPKPEKPRPESRTWKDNRGETIAEAVFAGATGTTAKLRLEDGSVLTVPLTSLSLADREWIRARR